MLAGLGKGEFSSQVAGRQEMCNWGNIEERDKRKGTS
jgi:hypothetical protein